MKKVVIRLEIKGWIWNKWIDKEFTIYPEMALGELYTEIKDTFGMINDIALDPPVMNIGGFKDGQVYKIKILE